MLETLARLLKQHHGLNENGCWLTDYAKIPKLRILASTTNGTSGTGLYHGRRVYWWHNDKTQTFETEYTQ
jgi:hypothetical protein